MMVSPDSQPPQQFDLPNRLPNRPVKDVLRLSRPPSLITL